MEPAVVVRIHPGQYHAMRALGSFIVLLIGLGSICPSVASGQIAADPIDTTAVVADPGDIVSVARAAQAVFERRRIRHLPLRMQPFGGECDEIVGRLCTTYSEGEWYPVPEAAEIVRLRTDLIATLDSLQEMAPGSEWILGQRVWYRHAAGDLEDARATAGACGTVDPAWCRALEGFALHSLGRYDEAGRMFELALAGMDEELRRRWTVLRWPVDSDLRDRLETLDDDPATQAAMLRLVWWLADPLYLVPGNDRQTEHYSRWTVARLRDRARNPFRLSWGADLEQLTVRHGWEMGWERSPARDYTSLDDVVGHKHPEGRDFMPSGDVVADPVSATPEDLRADQRRPRSLYAPAYAPILLPMEGQLAVFPRGETTVLVASSFLPEDTTWHAGHRHPRPWMEPGPLSDQSDRIGLFALPVAASGMGGDHAGAPAPLRAIRTGEAEGALQLEVPTGNSVVSAESWSPARMMAGRLRMGVAERLALPDIATLSDLILLESHGGPAESLEEVLDRVLPRARVRPGQPFAIGWEVAGLGFRPETLRFEVSVERADRGVLSRVGSFLRISSPPRPIALSWEDAGPTEPRHDFHYLAVDIPDLEPGRYRIRLALKTANRTDAVKTAEFEVVEPGF